MESLIKGAVSKAFAIVAWAARRVEDDGVDPHEALAVCESQCAAIRKALGCEAKLDDVGVAWDDSVPEDS